MTVQVQVEVKMALDQMCVCCLFSVVLLWSPSLGEDTGEIKAASR